MDADKPETPAEPQQPPQKKPSFSTARVLITVAVVFLIFDQLSTASITRMVLFGEGKGAREMARRASCMSNVKQLGTLVVILDARDEYGGETLEELIRDGKIADPSVARCPHERPGAVSYRIDPEGLRDPDRPLIVENAGLHQRISAGLSPRVTPGGHTEGFWRDDKVEVVFVKDEE